MIAPADGFQLISDAYSLAAGMPSASLAPIQDIWDGIDADGVKRPIAVVRPSGIGIRGTIMPPGKPLIEWLRDFDIFPVGTPYGNMAQGVWTGYKGLVSRAGVPLSNYADRPVYGHSYGAGLAAVVAVALQVQPCLFAVPNWFAGEFSLRFKKLNGAIFAEAGDIVPFLGFPPIINPRMEPVLYLTPPVGTSGLAAHHELATYQASYEAQFPTQKAA